MNEPAVVENPYVGLRPFEADESIKFFGRREQIAELLERLHQTRFLAVVGSSGCGKSSLIRAGLIPALLGGLLVEDRDRWLVAVMKPGDGPIRNLAAALCAAEGREPDADEVDALRNAIRDDHTEAVLDRIGAMVGKESNLLLLVDQFEEIFSFRGMEDDEELAALSRAQRAERGRRRNEAADFVDLMLELTEQAHLPVYTVLTMRTDFLGDCDLFFGFPEALNRSRYLVPRLDREQLRRAIEGPARLSGARLAPRLRDLLLNELGDRSDRLPVLQHALLRTWDIWHDAAGDGPIDLTHYQASGMLSDALNKHANEALRETDLELTGTIFKCLTNTDSNHRRVRRNVTLSELSDVTGAERREVAAVLERFREGDRNFVVLSDSAVPDDPRVDISHESLIRQWDQLKEWVDEERDARDEFLELVERARKLEQQQGSLLQDTDLEIALEWQVEQAPSAAWAKRYCVRDDDFSAAMRYLEESKVASSRRRAKLFALVGAVVALISVVTLVSVLYARAQAATKRARGTILVMDARDLLPRDPTASALLLLEVEQAEDERILADQIRAALDSGVAQLEFRHAGPISAAAFGGDGQRVLTVSVDGTARVWESGSGKTISMLRGAYAFSAAALSPDATRVVTGSLYGPALVWDAATGDTVSVLDTEVVYAVAFHPDGGRVVTGSADGVARVWDGTTGELSSTLLGHTDPIRAVAYSGDGTKIVTASSDNTARVWDAETGAPVGQALRHDGPVLGIAFSLDGEMVATGSSDGTARVWWGDGSDLLGMLPHGGAVRAVAWSANDHLVTASDGGTAVIWKGEANPVELLHPDTEVSFAEFNADGSRVVTAADDGVARVWRVEDGALEHTLRGHRGAVLRAVFGVWPDEGQHEVVLTASADNSARLWQLMTSGRRELVLGGHLADVSDASFNAAGNLIVTASGDGTAQVWDTTGTRRAVLEGHSGGVVTASFDPVGSRIVTASDDGTARVWDATTGVELAVIEGHEDWVNTAAFSPDGSRIVTASDDGTVRVWDAASGWDVMALKGDNPVSMAVFSPDGSRIVTASDDGTARVWDAATGDRLFELVGHDGGVASAVFSPNGNRIVTASDDHTARVWDAATGAVLWVLEGHDDWVAAASFDITGTRIVTASDDGTARVWDAENGDVLHVLQGHTDYVADATFSPDGTRIVTASDDGTARVWDAATGDSRSVLEGHTDFVVGAAFSPDGKWVVTASDDGTARVWEIERARTSAAGRDAIRARTLMCLRPEIRRKRMREDSTSAHDNHLNCERSFGRAR